MTNSITLKSGTAKKWDLETEEAKLALQKWVSSMEGLPFYCSTAEQKQELIAMLDHMDEIWLGTQLVTKEMAKHYLENYSLSTRLSLDS